VEINKLEISEIIRVFEASHFVTIHLQSGETVLDLRKVTGEDVLPARGAAEYDSEAVRLANNDMSQSPSSPLASPEIKTVTAPSLGIFRRSSAPDGTPYPKVGDEVGEGDTIAFLDVLGTQTPIIVGVPGRVVEICSEADQLVEYQQDLFKIQITGYSNNS